MFSSKRPKFSFNLTINELSNIPQVSGYCYIELQIRDGKKLRPSLSKLLHGHGPKEDTSASSISGKSNGTGTTSSSSTSVDLSDSSSSGSSGNVATTTSSKKIHNFRCTFNYNLTCNLKFPIKRRDNLIGNKHLLMRVYYVNDHGRHGDGSNGSETTELGRLEINLAEYLNFKEPLTSKYLLKNSKVNSILSVTLYLEQLPSNYDFHTQLQINDSPSTAINLPKIGTSHGTTESSKSESKNSSPTSGTFNIPQFDRKNLFAGLSNVLPGENGNTSSRSNSPSDLSDESDEENDTKKAKRGRPFSLARSGSSSRNISRSQSKTKKSHSKLRHHENAEPSHSSPNENETNGEVSMDPIVTKLYSKILESTWDPDLNVLLDHSPEKCIEDIFSNPDNPSGYNKELAKTYEARSRDFDDEDDNALQLNGLLNEVNFRENLKSWKISSVS